MGGLFPDEAIDKIWVLCRERPRGILDVGRGGPMATISISFCDLSKLPKGNEQMLNDSN